MDQKYLAYSINACYVKKCLDLGSFPTLSDIKYSRGKGKQLNHKWCFHGAKI